MIRVVIAKRRHKMNGGGVLFNWLAGALRSKWEKCPLFKAIFDTGLKHSNQRDHYDRLPIRG